MPEQQTTNALEAIIKVIDMKLKQLLDKMSNKKFDKAACIEAYTTIFNTVTEILSESTPTKLSNEAMNYVAQQLYDCVTVGDNGDLDPTIFTQRSTLENIPTKELLVIAAVFNGNPLVIPIVKEIKKRS